MSQLFDAPHLKQFVDIPYVSAGSIGLAPSVWASRHMLPNLTDEVGQLPTKLLDRHQVREICQNHKFPLLYCYICVMAWGGQGQLPGGTAHVRAAWDARRNIEARLRSLRFVNHSRKSAYSLFIDGKKIPGIGPAYFTKLMYFFCPSSVFYIMDQWTSKSVNLLTGRHVVKLAGRYVANTNDASNYVAYCESVDHIAKLVNVPGDQVEEMMMSKGGRHPWPWRAHVRGHWSNNSRV